MQPNCFFLHMHDICICTIKNFSLKTRGKKDRISYPILFCCLKQANRNVRILTSNCTTGVINCAAFPIKLHSDNWRPAGGDQTSHAFWEGVGSRRLYALGFRLHYNILKTENRKNLCRLHKVLIFLPRAVRRCPSPHLNRHFSPLIRKDKLIPEIPQNRIK